MKAGQVAATLSSQLEGEVLQPTDARFEDAAAIFNREFQHQPALIARCKTTRDVVNTVRAATGAGLPLTVRSGGHAHGGHSVGAEALVADLRGLDSLELDEAAMTVTVGGGVNALALIEHLYDRGLATVTGFDPRVGVSGLTLGGGYGLLSRMHGMACDQLLSAEVVLADGSVVVASANEHPELLWALKGAGANFGVVTRLTLAVRPLPELYGGVISYHAGRSDELLPRYAELVAGGLPDSTTVYVGIDTSPDEISSLSLIAFHLGDLEEGARVLAPLTSWGRPLAGAFDAFDLLALHQPGGDTFPEGFKHSWRSHFLPSFESSTVATLVGAIEEARAFPSWTVIEHMGGAIGALDGAATAFPHRRAAFGVVSALKWESDPPAEPLAWQERLWRELAPASLGSYVNYASDKHGPQAIRAAYGANLPRLIELKRRYDPFRVFCGNITIPAA
ncbi:MAG: FAD-binding oxidoreductase [Myxococcales bacterium]|nr:FAD-binding oxidoreductase [Myxococcales bacterium]MDP3499211.1 FAD-binding oxidoreductase [Myxococcales bacterium]